MSRPGQWRDRQSKPGGVSSLASTKEEKMTMRRSILLALAAALAASGLAWGQQSPYPSKPIRWIVPYTPGGITDSVTRIVAHKLEERLGQPIVVDNKPGANSIVGVDVASKAPPDGYTIVTVIAAHAAN